MRADQTAATDHQNAHAASSTVDPPGCQADGRPSARLARVVPADDQRVDRCEREGRQVPFRPAERGRQHLAAERRSDLTHHVEQAGVRQSGVVRDPGPAARRTICDEWCRSKAAKADAGRSYVLPSTEFVIALKLSCSEKCSGRSVRSAAMISASPSPTFSMW
jgi:hypothetical protein